MSLDVSSAMRLAIGGVSTANNAAASGETGILKSHWRCSQAAKELSPMSLERLSAIRLAIGSEYSQQRCSLKGDGDSAIKKPRLGSGV
jgi:hypothetical protein